jgi:hypothetical protein
MGPIRRNKPLVTADSALNQAITLLKRVGEKKCKSKLRGLVADLKCEQKFYRKALVSDADALKYANEYVQHYMSLGKGVVVPPSASIFFKGAV